MLVKGATSQPIINSDLNFTIIPPDKPYSRIKPETITPFAKVAFLRTTPQIFYIVACESTGIDRAVDTQALIDIVQAGLKGNSRKINIGATKDRTINEMKGAYFISDARIKNKDISYVHWVYSKNGFNYQQIAFSETKNKTILLKDVEKLFVRFKQNDPEKVCYSEGSLPFGAYQSGQFGYSANLDGTAWLRWSDVNKKIPGADIGGETGNGTAAFIISPVCFEKEKPVFKIPA